MAELECRVGLIAMGLDPGIGWAHKDAPYRDSAALDVLEPLRPVADAWVLRLLRARTSSRREFIELPNGQVRFIGPDPFGRSPLPPVFLPSSSRLHPAKARERRETMGSVD
jgi:hypothetical protein